MPAALGDVRDACAGDPLGRGACDPLAREPDLARGRHEPGDRPERRRLAGAVPAEDGDDLALAHAQRHAVERLHRPVARVDVVELEERRHQSVVPRYASITAGSRLHFGGRARDAIFLPKSSTVTESETRMTRFMWCSTRSTVRS